MDGVIVNTLKGKTLINAAIGEGSKANLGSVNMEGSKVKKRFNYQHAEWKDRSQHGNRQGSKGEPGIYEYGR